MDWLTADLHLGHANIIKFCKRPFRNVGEMDQAIINNINEKVGKDDRLIVLGDFSMGKERPQYIRRINCDNIWLITGNHDKRPGTSDGFTRVEVYHEEKFQLSDGTHKDIVLFHYPILEWNKWHRGSWHLFGHVHRGRNKQYKEELALDVGVDNHNYEPLCIADIEKIMSKKKVEKPL